MRLIYHVSGSLVLATIHFRAIAQLRELETQSRAVDGQARARGCAKPVMMDPSP
jgi:hypothetical protein